MFLSKNETETIPNKNICKELIEKWSRPAFDLTARHTDLDRQDEQTIRRLAPRYAVLNVVEYPIPENLCRILSQYSVEPELPPTVDPAQTGEKPNLSHFRTRLPQRANFDFVRRPKANDEEAAAAGPAPGRSAHLAAFEKNVLKKQTNSSARAGTVSITKIAPH
jgi:hypothetical protein